MKLLSPQRNEGILDAGCGIGVYSIEVGLKGASVVGVDTSRLSVKQASRVAHFVGIDERVRFQVSDLGKLPFKDELFEKAICVDVLEHIEKDNEAVKEISRVLKPRGLFVVHVPRSDPTRYLTAREQESPLLYRTYGHVREGYTRKSLSHLLKNNNFMVIREEETFKTFGGTMWKIHKLFRFHWSLFPLLYPISRLDVVSRRRGNGLLMVAKRRV